MRLLAKGAIDMLFAKRKCYHIMEFGGTKFAGECGCLGIPVGLLALHCRRRT